MSEAELTAVKTQLAAQFPTPWSFDVSPQETPPARNSATIYAADSTRICEIRGELAEHLARLIAHSVNHCALSFDA